jgi:hypothetical protein
LTTRLAGPTTASILLSRSLSDEGTLNLTQAPLYVARQDYSGARRYTVIIEEALGRRALMDLLYALAPYKAHGPDRFPRVLDNWRLHDRARSSSGSNALFQEHARSLGFSWREFANHRELFIRILEDQTEQARALPVLSWSRREDGGRSWEFEPPTLEVHNLIQSAAETVSRNQGAALDTLAGLITIPYFIPELHRKWQAWQPLTRGGKSNYVGPASVPVVALIHRRSLLNSAFVTSAEMLTQ